jgi:hypothetical protein
MENTAINAVLVEDKATGVFTHVLPATAGGFDFIFNRLGSLAIRFDFIFNRLGSLAIRTRYEKVWYHTETETGSPLEGIPEHLRDLLIEQQWGHWHVPGADSDVDDDSGPIQVDALFDQGGHSYQVVKAEDEFVKAIRFGTGPPNIPVVFHNKAEVQAAIVWKNAVEELDDE